VTLERRPLVALVALALVVGACAHHDTARGGGGTGTGPTPSREARTGPNGFVPTPIHWRGCGSIDECATVTVPLDYATPHGRTVRLDVLRVPATGRRQGAIFVNPGGPGGSATQFAAELPLILPRSLTEHFDIVGVDPRGVGRSAPFSCGVDYTTVYRTDPHVDTPAEQAALVQTADDVATRCATEAGDVLAHVGTRDGARDLDAVRAAMGEARLDFLGGSYGTVLGQVYADLFPTHVGRMVLDGVVDLGTSGLDLAVQQAAGFETALGRFASSCRTAACRTPDPIAAVGRVQALSQRPGGIPSHSADRSAGPGEVDLGLADALYSPATWPRLDQALSDALQGDGSGLVDLADEYLEAGSFDVYFAVNCLDFAWPTGDLGAFVHAAQVAQQAAPHFGESIVSDYLRCLHWPVRPDPLPATSAPGSPAILVISTTGDPATPYDGGVAVARRLAHGVLVTNEGDGHGAITSGSSCVNALVAAYFLDGAVPRDGTTCEAPTP
jgi:pimeloyl-ACP methyl ester carboxylesterase